MSRSRPQNVVVTIDTTNDQTAVIIPATNTSLPQQPGVSRGGDDQTITLRAAES